MPIGAGIGAAVVGAGSAVISSKAQKKAASRAADTSAQATRENNALAREFYGRNEGHLAPTIASGQRAGGALNAMLLGPMPAPANNNAAGASGFIPTEGFDRFNPVMRNALAEQFEPDLMRRPGTFAFGPQNRPMRPNALAAPVFAGTPAPAGAVTTVPGSGGAADPFEAWRNSMGYQRTYDEGMNALNSGYAGRGVLQSGDAVREAVKFGQDHMSSYLGQYQDRLAQQQGFGLDAARALAGVGGNTLSTMTSNNALNATNQGNAFLARGNATAGMWGGIAGGIGTGVGLASSFGGGGAFGPNNSWGIAGSNGVY